MHSNTFQEEALVLNLEFWDQHRLRERARGQKSPAAIKLSESGFRGIKHRDFYHFLEEKTVKCRNHFIHLQYCHLF